MFPVCDADAETYLAPVPSAGVFDAPGIRLCLNTQWASHLDGLLGQLLNRCLWAGSETDVDAALQEVNKLLVKLAEVGDCESEPIVTPYALFRDEKTMGQDGGTFTAGAWRRRQLGFTFATGGFATMTDDQITLPAGTYRCRIQCPAAAVNKHQARLYNVTDSAVLLWGSSQRTAATLNTVIPSIIIGRFTLAASKVLEVQHRCETTVTNTGFGYAAGFDTEVYTIAEIWKEA